MITTDEIVFFFLGYLVHDPCIRLARALLARWDRRHSPSAPAPLAETVPISTSSPHEPGATSDPPPVDAPASPALAQSAPHQPDAVHDPITLGNGTQFLLDQAHATGVPLSPKEARAMAARMLNGEEV